MIDITIRDFQSVENVTLHVEGFTALVGRSNIGKSALVRAVQAALTGAPVADYVRHGPNCARRVQGIKHCKCFCSVHICTEGFDLLWEKGDAINRYTFNNAVYDRVSQGTPEFLLPFTAPIKVGNEKKILQISEQFSPIFLLDQTGTVVADVLGDVAQLNRINSAIRLAEKDRREAVATRKVREQDIKEAQRGLQFYQGLDEALEVSGTVGKRLKAVQETQARTVKLVAHQAKHEALRGGIEALEGPATVKIPAQSDLTNQFQKYSKVARYASQVAERAIAIRALGGVDQVALPDMGRVRKPIEVFRQLRIWVDAVYAFQTWFEGRSADVIVPAIDKLTKASEQFTRVNSLTLREAALKGVIANLEQERLAQITELTGIKREFDALGVCPTCAQPIHSDVHT